MPSDLDDLLRRLGDRDYRVYADARDELQALAPSADVETARYLLLRAGTLRPVHGSSPELDVVHCFPAARYFDALMEAVPALSPTGRMAVVQHLANHSTPAALDALLTVLEQGGWEWEGWGNPLLALDDKPVHGDVVFPRLIRLRKSELKRFIDWILLAYLAAGEVAAEDLADEPDAAESLIVSAQDYLRRLPKQYDHPQHEQKRRNIAAAATALGVFKTAPAQQVLERLAQVPDPLVSGNAQAALARR